MSFGGKVLASDDLVLFFNNIKCMTCLRFKELLITISYKNNYIGTKCLMCCVTVSVYYYYKAVDGVCVVNINKTIT